MKVRYEQAEPFVTKDGSIIRELIHPRGIEASAQSLAEATVLPGSKTALHVHLTSQEIYHVTKGRGTMVLGDESFGIGPGDSVLIPPGTPHSLAQSGGEELVVLCCCSPPYSDEDTELIREEGA